MTGWRSDSDQGRLALALALAFGLHAALLLNVPLDWRHPFSPTLPKPFETRLIQPAPALLTPPTTPAPLEWLPLTPPPLPKTTALASGPIPQPVARPAPPKIAKPVEKPQPVANPAPPKIAQPAEKPQPVAKPAPPKIAKPAEKPQPVAKPAPPKITKPAEKPQPVAKSAPSKIAKPAEKPQPVAKPAPPKITQPSEKPQPVAKPAPPKITQPAEKPQPVAKPTPPAQHGAGRRGLDSAALLGQVADLETEQRRPTQAAGGRVRRVSPTETGSAAGFYAADWARKVTRVGEMNFPDAARRLNTSAGPSLEVAIAADGSLREVRIARSSGYAELDEAARRIVKLAAPFPPFPPELRQDVDLLRIAAPWRFDPGGRIRAR